MSSPNIPHHGYCLHVRRERVHTRGENTRTLGQYQCFWNGKALNGLGGQMVECHGPGDNTDKIGDAQNRRIAAGIYPLAVHKGMKYVTYGYTGNLETKAKPRPGLLLKGTDEREAILVHPSSGFLWSTGCLNPCSGLTDAKSNINYIDSRSRVIAIIDSIVDLLGPRMPKGAGQSIPGAVVWVEGEPV